MGFDVMSRRVRVHSSTSSSPSPSSRTTSLERDKFMSDAFFHKSLTPNRKHHKLLKDGSEVWSEEVEKIFVEGLKEYWESPWATYSRGRSRWRNQFLVEHLKKAGIERSKKQVASHIQVLRNMWRGEPEFHLVAGGEELFTDNGLLASPKGEPSDDGLPSLESMGQDAQSPSSSSSTPDFIGAGVGVSLPHSAAFPKRHSPASSSRSIETPSEREMFGNIAATPFAMPMASPPPSPPNHRITGGSVKLEPLHMGAGLSSLPASPMSGYLGSAGVSPLFPSVAQSPNRLLSLSLWAEGMSVYTADVDRLSAAMSMPPISQHDAPPSILFRIKISISAIEDLHSSPNLHGFHGAVTLTSRWASTAQCVTKLHAGQTCIGQESDYLVPTSHDANSSQSVTCALPESSLSRCKWLPIDQDRITQQILVDGVIVAAFVYTLERTVIPGSTPSAELVGFQKYRMPVRGRTTSQPFSPPLTPETAQSSGTFYPGGGYHNPMASQASMSAQLLQDVLDPSLTHAGGYPGPMSAPTSSGMLYRHS